MKNVQEFFRKNFKFLSIGCSVIFFVLAIVFSGFFSLPTQTSNADTTGSWTDKAVAFATSDTNGPLGESEDRPILISSAEEFAYLAKTINDGLNNDLKTFKYYKLTRPIDLSGYNWTPIGNTTNLFNGSLDCNNKPILGMTISGQEKTGLFGVAGTVTVKNAIIMSVDITTSDGNTGIIAGEVNGTGFTIENVQIDGKINCLNSDVSTNDSLGGLIGTVKGGDATIKNVYLDPEFEIADGKGDSCCGPFIGCVDNRLSKINVSITESYCKMTSTSGIKTANFAGTDWFTNSTLNNGFPLLKSQYWIGRGKTYSEESLSKFEEDTEDSEYLAYRPTFYTVTITTNKGEASVESSSTVGAGTSVLAVEGEKITLSHTDITGYSFAYSGASVSNGQFTMPASNVTITGTYTPITYNITWNGSDASLNASYWDYGGSNGYTSTNSGSNSKYTFSGKTATSSVTFDSELGYSTPIPLRLGYTFNGWYTASSGGTQIANATGQLTGYVTNKKWNNANNVTLYAQWTKNSYSITYNYNGGSASNTSSSYSLGSSIKINAPTRAGYTFTGWTVKSAFKGKRSATINLNSGVMEYSTAYPNAVYFPLFYQEANVTYTAKTSDVNNESRHRQYTDSGTKYKNGSGTSSTACYTALWYHGGMTSDETYYTWSPGTSYTISANQVGNLTLTANWTPITYTISYTLNGGTVSTNPTSYTVETATFKLNNPTKTGYTFAGWTGSNGTTAQTSVSIAKGSTGNKSYTANWTANTYKVHYYDTYNNTTDYTEVTYTYNDSSKKFPTGSLPSTNPEWTLVSWTTSPTSITATSYTAGASVNNLSSTAGAVINLYSLYKRTLTLQYSANGGSGTMASKSSIQYYNRPGKKCNLPEVTADANTFTRTGYTFKNWNTKADGTGTSYSAGASVKLAENQDSSTPTTLYAQWTANTYSIGYNLNSGTAGSSAPTSATYDKQFTISNPTRTGYTFNGWTITGMDSVTHTYGSSTSTATSLSGVKATTFKNLRSTSGTVTFTAQWTANTYLVTYNANGGTFLSTTNLSIASSTGNWNYKSISTGTFAPDTTYLLTIGSATRTAGTATAFTARLYDFTDKEDVAVQQTGTFGQSDILTLKSLSTLDPTHDNQILLYAGAPGSTAGNAVTFSNISLTVSKSVTYDSTYGTLPAPTREGYTFNGWWTTASGGTQVTSSSKVSITAGQTLYVHWVENASYLSSKWQTLVATGLSSTVATVNPKIKTITFTKTQPSSGTQISVGTISETSTAAFTTTVGVKDVTAYVTTTTIDDTTYYNITFYSPYTIYAPQDSSFLFSNSSSSARLTGLTSISFGNFNTEKTTAMSYMFYYCQALTSLDVSNFNTSNVTTMSAMFRNCAVNSLDLSNFDTSSVTNMAYMFLNCKALTSLDLSKFNTEKVTSMQAMFSDCYLLTSLDVSKFNTIKVTSMASMFSGCSDLTSLDLSKFNTEKVTSMATMFYNCQALTSLDLSKFNTEKVTSMESMFRLCTGLTSITFGSNFNASSVTSMSNMFNNCTNLTSLNLNNFNASSVTNMQFMFNNCKVLSTLDLSSFDMNNVTSYSNMFTNCTALEVLETPTNCSVDVTLPVTMYDLAGTSYTSLPNVTKSKTLVTNHSFLSRDWQSRIATKLSSTSTVFDISKKINSIAFTRTQPSSGTKVSVGTVSATSTSAFTTTDRLSDVTAYVTGSSTNGYSITIYSPYTIFAPADSSYLFSGIISTTNSSTSETTPRETSTYSSSSYNQTTFTFDNFSTSTATDMSNMFKRCAGITTLNLSKFNTSNVTTMQGMFSYCSALKTLNINGFNTSSVTDMSHMFSGCTALTSLDLSSFDTSNVTTMSQMFNNCTSATSINVSGFNTAKVTDMSQMFNGCESLTTLNLSGFNTSSVTSMASMFYNCKTLTSLNVSGFNTANVTNMFEMFSGCSKLTSLNVTGFNTSSVTNMADMFCNCSALTALDVRNFNTANVLYMENMFAGCSTLTEIKGLTTATLNTNFTTTNMISMESIFADCSGLTSLDLSKFDMSKVTSAENILKYCFALGTLKTPINCSTVAPLPILMSDTSGNSYVNLPNVTQSITLSPSGEASYFSSDWQTRIATGLSSDVETVNPLIKTITFTKTKPSSGTPISVGTLGVTSTDAYKSINRIKDITAYVTGDSTNGYDITFYSTATIYAPLNSSRLFSNSSSSAYLTGLTSLDLSGLNMKSATSANYMFIGCSALETLKTPTNCSLSVSLPDLMCDSAGTDYTSLPKNSTVSITLTKVYAYFSRNWQTRIAIGLSSDVETVNPKINKITFTKTQPSSGTQISVGTLSATSTSAFATTVGLKDVIAYVTVETVDSNEVYNITFYSPATIYAPVNSGRLFANLSTSACLKGLTSISFGNFNTSKVTDMNRMFGYCTSLTSLTVSSFDTSKVTNMEGMFYECSGLTTLNLSKFNASSVTNMQYMFVGCTSLTTLNLSSFDFTRVTTYTNMFYNFPSDCSIYVKDATAKTWVEGKFTDLTNVQVK